MRKVACVAVIVWEWWRIGAGRFAPGRERLKIPQSRHATDPNSAHRSYQQVQATIQIDLRPMITVRTVFGQLFSPLLIYTSVKLAHRVLLASPPATSEQLAHGHGLDRSPRALQST